MRLFISYTGADTAWAEWIAWQLEAAGHEVTVQAWDFRPGENFVVQMRRALDAAERTLAVVSAAYLESVYGSDEWTAAFVHDRPHSMSLLVIRVEAVPLPRLLQPWIYVDLVGLDAKAAAQELLQGLKQGRRKPAQPPAFPPAARLPARPSFPGRGPAVSNLPPRNPTFTGREALLARLRQQLTAGDGGASRPVAVLAGVLYGLGGVGKTQLALEYAHRYAADYGLVWWIPSENALTIPATLARLAPELGLASQADQEELATAVLDVLRVRDRWLLVFDNAEQPHDLTRWQPGGSGGRVLVTSRNPAWGAFAQPIRVDVLDRAEAVALLLRRTPHQDHVSADELAEQLGDLALALEQAAAYLEQTGMPLTAYLAAYRRRRGELLAKGRPIAYQGQVDTTWQLSTDRLAETSPAGLELLRLCAFLASEAIPLKLFTAAPERLPPALATVTAEDGEAGVQEAAGACYRYSLVARDQVGIQVHRLVQQVVRAQLAEQDHQVLITTAVELLASAFPPVSKLGDPAHWRRCAQLLPHMLAAADHAQSGGLASAATASLLQRAGTYLWYRADYPAALGPLERALILQEATLGPGHPEVGVTLDRLGILLRDQGDLAGARTHLERALAITETALGPDHPDVGRSLRSLGRLLRDQNDLAGARAYLERALILQETALGPNHPAVAGSLRSLGILLRFQGDLAGARAYLERALILQETALGPDHPEVGATLTGLGSSLREQGDLAGARTYLERALVITEGALGPDHPEIGDIHRGLGRVLREEGDLATARTHLERAVAIGEAALGPHHPSVGFTLLHLGLILREQGELASARIHLQRAHTILQATQGPEHPDTQAAAHWLTIP